MREEPHGPAGRPGSLHDPRADRGGAAREAERVAALVEFRGTRAFLAAAREHEAAGLRVLGVRFDLMLPKKQPGEVAALVQGFLEERAWALPTLVYHAPDYRAINARFELPGAIPVNSPSTARARSSTARKARPRARASRRWPGKPSGRWASSRASALNGRTPWPGP
ncbi:MAG TPA: hypothetical protein VF530_17425 [Planctomycetota bacterium]